MKLIIIFKIDIPLIVNDLNIIKKQFSIYRRIRLDAN